MSRRSGLLQNGALPSGLALAMLVSGCMVYQASNAAFTASTSTGADFAAGTVQLALGSPGSVVFDASNLKPGDNEARCVNVTYSGSLTAQVRVYVSALTSSGGDYSHGAADYLGFTITEGTGATAGAGGDCTGFSAGALLGDPLNDLGDFFEASPDYATGVGSWTPTGGISSTKSYRLTYRLYDDNTGQGSAAQATLTWEARNT